MWHALDKEVLQKLKTRRMGLVRKRGFCKIKKNTGKTEIKQTSKMRPFAILLEQFKSVFVLILFAAAIFLFTKHYVDFGVIMVVVVINSFIGFFQQYKAEKIIIEMKRTYCSKS